MKTAHRSYLREKWDRLKWEIEEMLDVYGKYTEEDLISKQRVEEEKSDIKDLLTAIRKEIG